MKSRVLFKKIPPFTLNVPPKTPGYMMGLIQIVPCLFHSQMIKQSMVSKPYADRERTRDTTTRPSSKKKSMMIVPS